ncbi:MAG: hypothetical protein AAGI45_19695, partial [Cyanobacteria bacterium P01_H01_bin.26]
QSPSLAKNGTSGTKQPTIGTSTNFHFGDVSVIQPKLSFGKAYKKYGQEADRTAGKMTQALHTDLSKVENPPNTQLAQLNHPIQTKATTTNNTFLKQGTYGANSSKEQRANALIGGIQKSGERLQRKEMALTSPKPQLGEMEENGAVFSNPPDYIYIRDDSEDKNYKVEAGQSFLNMETIKWLEENPNNLGGITTARKVNTVDDDNESQVETVEVKDGHHRFVGNVLYKGSVDLKIGEDVGQTNDSWSSMKWHKHPNEAYHTDEEAQKKKDKLEKRRQRMMKKNRDRKRKRNKNKS